VFRNSLRTNPQTRVSPASEENWEVQRGNDCVGLILYIKYWGEIRKMTGGSRAGTTTEHRFMVIYIDGRLAPEQQHTLKIKTKGVKKRKIKKT